MPLFLYNIGFLALLFYHDISHIRFGVDPPKTFSSLLAYSFVNTSMWTSIVLQLACKIPL